MSTKHTYIIEDWAGNTLFEGRTFRTFEDAWHFIWANVEDEEELEELYVVEVRT